MGHRSGKADGVPEHTEFAQPASKVPDDEIKPRAPGKQKKPVEF
jgi:hypothetical protein